MNARPRLATFVICVACAHAVAETYTYVGPYNGLWSIPTNWLDGNIPVSSADSIILDARGVHDLGDDFDVGTIYTAPGGIEGNSFSVHQLVSNQYYQPMFFPAIKAIGNISLFSQFYQPNAIPAVCLMIQSLHIDSSTVDITGGVFVGGLSGSGTIHLNNWSALEAGVDDEFSHLTVTGTGENRLDLLGTLRMTGGVPADFTLTTLDLGRQTFTLSAPTTGKLSVEGDLKLGNWIVSGQEFFNSQPGLNPVDQIHVSGTLDLTQAQIDPIWSGVFPRHEISTYGDHLVLATYGNRIGEFPQTFIPAIQVDWDVFLPLFDMPIHYTTPENSGPGEIWLIIPEPGLVSSLAILIPLTLRRRK